MALKTQGIRGAFRGGVCSRTFEEMYSFSFDLRAIAKQLALRTSDCCCCYLLLLFLLFLLLLLLLGIIIITFLRVE